MKYAEILALLYFKDVGKEYEWDELREILGYTPTQLDKLVQKLIGENYLEYDDNEMIISEKGLIFLVANNYIGLSYISDIEWEKIVRIGQPVSKDDPWIPRHFND